MKNKHVYTLCLTLVLAGCLSLTACQQKTNAETESKNSAASETASVSQPESKASDKTQSEQNSSAENKSSTAIIETSPDLSEFGELDSETIEKLSKLKPDMTMEQVHEILGEPDKLPETGLYWEYFYINGNENRWIKVGYGNNSISSVQLGDSELHKGVFVLLNH